jgi:hypothetical protein
MYPIHDRGAAPDVSLETSWARPSVVTIGVVVGVLMIVGGLLVANNPYSKAVEEANHVLALLKVPPHAVRLDRSPTVLLDQPAGTPGALKLVDKMSWWDVAMSPTDVTAWILSHRPAGLTVEGGQSSSGPDGRTGGVLYGDPLAPRDEQVIGTITLTAHGTEHTWLRTDGLVGYDGFFRSQPQCIRTAGASC